MVLFVAKSFGHVLTAALTLATGTVVASEAPIIPWTAPPQSSRIANPLLPTDASVATGRKLFQRDCLSCHGERGRGDGFMAALIDRRPGDLTAERMATQTDGELFWKISNGRAPMPTFEEFLTPTQRWHLINYVRTLGPKPILAAARVDQPAQVPPPAPTSSEQAPITRKEYEDLLRSMAAMQAEINGLRGALQGQTATTAPVTQPTPTPPITSVVVPTPPPSVTAPAAPSVASTSSSATPLTDTRPTNLPLLGTTKFLVSGFGFAEFIDRDDESSTFSAGLAPVFLWEVSDRLLFEAEVELTLTEHEEPAPDPDDPFGVGGDDHSDAGSHSDDGTDVELTYANFSYLLHDYAAVGAGKFLVPFGAFNERLHPAWINKLPQAPLVFDHDGGLVPHGDLGIFVRGGFPVRRSKVNYVAYLSNGPTIEPDGPGDYSHDDFPDPNDGKAVGGRLGFLPVPRMEIGYSARYGNVAPSGEDDVRQLLQGVDFVWQPQIDALAGSLEFRAEWVWSYLDFGMRPAGSGGHDGGHDHGGAHVLHVDDPSPAGVGLDRHRAGGYLQLAYRPTLAHSAVLRNLEIVSRYDHLDRGHGMDDRRWTFGLNYWLTPSAVLKGAYQFSESDSDQDAVIVQGAVGF